MNQRDVIDALRREAGRVGCDAIVILGGIEQEHRDLFYSGAGLRASCIVRTGVPPAGVGTATSAPTAASTPRIAGPTTATAPSTTTTPPAAVPPATTAVSSFPPAQ